jgi:hypothetical protein
VKGDHVVINLRTFVFECKHCGLSYPMAAPAPINLVVAASKAWLSDHRHCSAPSPVNHATAPLAELREILEIDRSQSRLQPRGTK